MPDIRSLQLVQEHLINGVWKRRHLDALINDPRTVAIMHGILTCSNQWIDEQYQAEQRQDAHQQEQRQNTRKQHMRNSLCICASVCPEETAAWAACARKAARALREGGDQAQHECCYAYRRRLENCAQRQTSIIVQAALLPPDRDDLTL